MLRSSLPADAHSAAPRPPPPPQLPRMDGKVPQVMSALNGWKTVPGADLIDLVQSNEDLSAALPDLPGVYMWKRDLRPPKSVIADPVKLIAWCDRLSDTAIGQTGVQQLSHFLRIHSVELCGGALPSEKRKTLERLFASQQNRKWFASFLSSLGAETPALYVGEAESLAARIVDHLTGRSGFGSTIERHERLSWSDLSLRYYTLESSVKAQRTAIEYLASVVTVAGYTSRIG